MTFGDECATDCREQTGAIAARSSRASSGRRSLLESPEVSKQYLSMLKRRHRRMKISENSRCGGIVRNVQCNMFNTIMFNAMQASDYEAHTCFLLVSDRTYTLIKTTTCADRAQSLVKTWICQVRKRRCAILQGIETVSQGGVTVETRKHQKELTLLDWWWWTQRLHTYCNCF